MRILFIQHVPFEHPGYLLKWAKQHNYSYSIAHVYQSTALPAMDDFDMLIIMGGPMGAYQEDKYEWLIKEKQFVKASIDAGKKVLGICLGCQIIANVLGSKIYPHTQKEIGWWPVKKTDENKYHPLVKHLPDEFTTFHWHGDTFNLPTGAIHLFKSTACEQQGFLYKNNVAGLQFHSEVESNLLQDITEHEKAELTPSTYIQSEEEINRLLPTHVEAQHHYISGFADALINL